MRIEKNLVRSDLQNIVWGPGSTLHIIWELGAGNWVLSNDIRSLETAVDVIYAQKTIVLVPCSTRAFLRSSCQ